MLCCIPSCVFLCPAALCVVALGRQDVCAGRLPKCAENINYYMSKTITMIFKYLCIYLFVIRYSLSFLMFCVWHEDEANLSRKRRTPVIRDGAHGNGERGGGLSYGNRGWQKEKGDGRQGTKVDRLLIVGITCLRA